MFWLILTICVFGAPGLFFVALGFWIYVFKSYPYNDVRRNTKNREALGRVVNFPARWNG